VSVPPPSLPGAERLEPIGLGPLDAAAALRRRFDTKYLLPRDAVAELLERLRPTHRILELNGLRHFDYRTTYFDTDELAAFRDHLQGRRRRLKVRIRHYVDTGDCFFELKLRGARDCTIKRRVPHDPRLRRCLGAASLATLERWVQDAYGRPAPSPLTPVLEVAYTRATLVSPGRCERLTLDLDLHMWAAGADGWGHLDPDLAIVETKSAGGPALAVRELKALGARPLDRMSKYCVGVVLALGRARGNALLPVIRHCAGRHAPIRAVGGP
jgi:VTC domain